ncbi:MAG: TatD family nuclease-associated radical SAM protein [Fusobacterium sp.]|nr:TatD family nuclease-associated radical SAM protein [Fusobacterium sp.]
MSNTLVYLLDDKIYINLTNNCTNRCIFCLRQDKDDVCGQEMWLDTEVFSANDVIEQLEATIKKQLDAGKNHSLNEIIFCGYGEPLLKLELLKEVAAYIRKNYPNTKIRVNSNGHANLIYKRNVAEELKPLIDDISISLNASTEEEYNELSQPNIQGAFDAVKDFIKSCSDAGISTTASVVENYKGRHLDLEECEKIATSLGAKFRVREWITNGYS